jgi:hypothetical protein
LQQPIKHKVYLKYNQMINVSLRSIQRWKYMLSIQKIE